MYSEVECNDFIRAGDDHPLTPNACRKRKRKMETTSLCRICQSACHHYQLYHKEIELVLFLAHEAIRAKLFVGERSVQHLTLRKCYHDLLKRCLPQLGSLSSRLLRGLHLQ